MKFVSSLLEAWHRPLAGAPRRLGGATMSCGLKDPSLSGSARHIGFYYALRFTFYSSNISPELREFLLNALVAAIQVIDTRDFRHSLCREAGED